MIAASTGNNLRPACRSSQPDCQHFGRGKIDLSLVSTIFAFAACVLLMLPHRGVGQTVSPNGDTLYVTSNTTGNLAHFTYDFIGSHSCARWGKVTDCRLSGDDNDDVLFSVSDAGVGKVYFCVDAWDPYVCGYYNVVVQDPPGPPLDVNVLDGVNPTMLEHDRNQCLRLAAGAAADVQCGDLLVAHPLPTQQVLGKAYTPYLLYNSASAEPRVTVAMEIEIAEDLEADSVTATLLVGGSARAAHSWGADYFRGAPVRVTLSGAYAATGVVPYSVVVQAGALVDTVSNSTIVVDRSTSEFGRGWWLAGWERLYQPNTAQMFWVGGDGSARVYSRTATGIWVGVNRTRPDTIRESGGELVRYLPNGSEVHFDTTTGIHTKTRDAQGNETTFTYEANRLRVVTLPHNVPYSFYYDAYGKLDEIHIHGTVLNAVVSAGQLYSVTDPDNLHFTYYYSGNKLSRRRDKRGKYTQYGYDDAGKVSYFAVDVYGLDLRTDLWAQESNGLTTPVPVDSVRTTVDGPRPAPPAQNGVYDIYKFYLNEYGEVDRIVDPVGQQTTVGRYETQFPGLISTVDEPNYHHIIHFWDLSGRPTLTSDGVQRTYYYWDDPDCPYYPTEVETDEGVTTQYHYDNLCRLDWVQTGGQSSTRTIFSYASTNRLPSTATYPIPAGQSVHPEEAYGLDGLGNVVSIAPPVGGTTYLTRDVWGRVTTSETALNATETRTTQTYYDGMGRDTATVTSAPRHDYTGYTTGSVESVRLSKTYDAAGNLTDLQRFLSPDSAHLILHDQWAYDAAGRVDSVTHYARGTEIFGYDESGNVTRRRAPGCGSAACEITTTYDALNRVDTRIIPATQFASASPLHPLDPLAPDSVTLPADTAHFTYDATGMRTADNRAARIRRSYFQDGLIHTDSIWIRDYDSATYSFSYGLEYVYDHDRRLTEIRYPAGTAPGTTPTASYTWDNVTGLLQNITDVSGLTYTYGYDDQGNVETISYPGSLVETRTYDEASRLATRTIPNFRAADYTRNYEGEFEAVSGNGSNFQGDHTGLGSLIWHRGAWNEVDPPDPSMWADIDVASSKDPIGNEIFTLQEVPEEQFSYTYTDYRDDGSVWHVVTGDTVLDGYDRVFRTSEDIQYDYDSAGNRVGVERVNGVKPLDNPSIPHYATLFEEKVYENTQYYYDLAGQLRVTDQRKHVWNRNYGDIQWEDAWKEYEPGAVFEEYVYDALGRRIAKRSRPDPQCSTWCWEYYDIYVWSGDQLIHERRQPDPSTSYYSASGRYGLVTYTPGIGTDAAVSLVRGNLASTPSFSAVVLHRNGKGLYDSGTDAAGGRVGASQYLWAGMQPPTYPRSYSVVRGLAGLNLYHGDWLGSLITDKSDNSGLSYKRNRYYDPVSGQFTQPDPIGLAGGLNVYGYAGGDPVTFSDPFGLCPYEDVNGERSVNVDDCPNDKRKDIFKVIAANPSHEAQATLQFFVDYKTDFALENSKFVCDPAQKLTDGCTTGGNKMVRVNVNQQGGIAAAATTVVHESFHSIVWSGGQHGKMPWEEGRSWVRALNFYRALDPTGQMSPKYSGALQQLNHMGYSDFIKQWKKW